MGRTRRRRFKGGTVLAEGASAKVVYPAPQCADGRDMAEYVARVPNRRTYAEVISKSYPRLIRLLTKIDPNQDYFYYPEHCEFETLTDENTQDGITNKNKKYVEILKRGNQKWFDWRHPEQWKQPTEEQLNHLKKAIELLHKHKIVHGDLNGDNVIYGNDGLPRIIDFTQAVHNAPKDYIEQEQRFVERGWPTLEYYAVYQSNTPEGKQVNDERKKRRYELLKTRKRKSKKQSKE
jgi:serine/threonine protein kinase